MQIPQIDHAKFPPRPVVPDDDMIPDDDMMSITTNQRDDNTPDPGSPEVVLEDDEEASRPEDFSPRVWQLFNRISRRGTEPLFPADWQVHKRLPPTRSGVILCCC